MRRKKVTCEHISSLHCHPHPPTPSSSVLELLGAGEQKKERVLVSYWSSYPEAIEEEEEEEDEEEEVEGEEVRKKERKRK